MGDWYSAEKGTEEEVEALDERIGVHGNLKIIQPTPEGKTYWISPEKEDELQVFINTYEENGLEEKRYGVTKVNAYHGHIAIKVEDVHHHHAVFFIVYTRRHYETQMMQFPIYKRSRGY